MRAILFYNTRAGIRRPDFSPERTVGILEGWGWEVTARPLGRGSSEAIFRQGLRERPDVILVAGGDGTVHHLVEVMAGSSITLAVLPAGTANDLARTLGLPPDPIEALYVLRDGLVQAIDLGVINGHYFVNVASIGVSAAAAVQVTADQKRRLGQWAYRWSALRELARPRRMHIQLETSQGEEELEIYQLSIANGRHFGGGYHISEPARIDDRLLDIVAVEPQPTWSLLRALGRQGGMAERVGSRSWRVPWCRIRVAGPLYANLDGEPYTLKPPLEARVVPEALRVYAPREPMVRSDGPGMAAHLDPSLEPSPTASPERETAPEAP